MSPPTPRSPHAAIGPPAAEMAAAVMSLGEGRCWGNDFREMGFWYERLLGNIFCGLPEPASVKVKYLAFPGHGKQPGTACSKRQNIPRERQHAREPKEGREAMEGSKSRGVAGLVGGELSQEEAGMAEAKAEAGGSGYMITTVMVAASLDGDGALRTHTVSPYLPEVIEMK